MRGVEDHSSPTSVERTSELASITGKILRPHKIAIQDVIEEKMQSLRSVMSDLRYPLLFWS
jgi:hypothetical protein